MSASIPCEDDEESYDDVESLNSSSLGQRISLDKADSPMEDDDDIYEVVPGTRLSLSIIQKGIIAPTHPSKGLLSLLIVRFSLFYYANEPTGSAGAISRVPSRSGKKKKENIISSASHRR